MRGPETAAAFPAVLYGGDTAPPPSDGRLEEDGGARTHAWRQPLPRQPLHQKNLRPRRQRCAATTAAPAAPPADTAGARCSPPAPHSHSQPQPQPQQERPSEHLARIGAMVYTEEEEHVSESIRAGMRELLLRHPVYELRALCKVIGVPAAAAAGGGGGGGGRRVRFNKAAQVAAVFETVLGARATQREYVGVLKVVWEGTLYEYLRAEGLGAQADAKRVDPRESVLKHWRRAEVAGTAPLAHVDALLPRTVRVAGRLAQATTDPTALALLANVASAESALKAIERLLRDGGMLSEGGYGGMN